MAAEMVRKCGWVSNPLTVPREQYVCWWEPKGGSGGASGWEIPEETGGGSGGRSKSEPPTSKAKDSGISYGGSDPCIQYEPEQPYIPPTKGRDPVPAQIVIDYNHGWTGRARSIAAFQRAGYAEFTVPNSTIGAVVGLNTGYKQTGYGDIKFAFYVARGVARIVESGQVVQYVGTFTSPARFRIQRRGGVIEYRMNGNVVRTTPNDSAPMHLDAALYSGGDTVYDPEIAAMEDTNVGAGSFEPMTGIGSDYAYAFGSGSFLPLIGSGRAGVRGAGSFEPLIGVAGDRPYGAGDGSFLPISGYGQGGLFVPGYAIGDGSFAQLTGAASGLTGTIGQGAGEFAPLIGRGSDRIYGESRGSFEPLVGYGDDYEGNGEAVIFQQLLVAAGAQVQSDLFVVWNERMEILGVFAAQVILDAGIHVSLEIASSMAASAILNATIFTTLAGQMVVPTEDQSPQVWVVNAETQASTRYENYPFNSFAKIGDAYYGCRADGLYRLEGDTDDGLPVQAMVSFGKQDFGTSAQKRVEHCYMGVASSGRMFLRVIVEGRDYTYAARSSSEELKMHRVDVGKGIRANWLEFELYNSDGDDFELASVEFAAVPLSRRI